MKGNEKVIETLNDLLSDELTAINQYIVHAEMAEDWGYPVLHESAEKRAITEMKHLGLSLRSRRRHIVTSAHRRLPSGRVYAFVSWKVSSSPDSRRLRS